MIQQFLKHVYSVCILFYIWIYLGISIATKTTNAISELAAARASELFEIYPMYVINQGERLTTNLSWSKFGDSSGEGDSVNSGMHLETVIERIRRYIGDQN